jgi:hypothetical protein
MAGHGPAGPPAACPPWSAAACESAGSTPATVVPLDWRLIQLIETGRNTELDAVIVSSAALLQEV